jgi:glycosyltransferase involved in cell wall biosynthesis
MNPELFIHKIYSSLLKRSGIKNNKKSRQSWLDKKYTNQPLISFIIQSHNKSVEIKHIVSKLRKASGCEIIVIDDGSEIIHTKRIANFLQGANEFLIRANDLYENIMYNKAIRFANGKYIALLQDDNQFDNLSWVDEAMNYFSKYPDLVILGGRDGLDFEVVSKDVAHDVPYKEKNFSNDFSFVHIVNRAPMWIHKKLFDEKLKNIDFNFAPFQYDDCELCLRAWLTGLQVGWYNAGFKSLSAGGMRIWNSQFTQEQCICNQKLLYDLYKDKKAILDKLVNDSNREQIEPHSINMQKDRI